MKRIYLLLITLFFCAVSTSAQSPLQTIRGALTDTDSGAPLPGAHILLFRSDTLRTVTDEAGKYVIPNVPVGRYRLQASYLGYSTVTIAELLVEAGKETVQNVQLRERSEALQEVVVKAQAEGSNDIFPVSAYTITVEEQFRFPATYFDPGRVALSYPGVTGLNDGTNIISVRGNSPSAVKWRLEGVEIVNPNHTANAGTFSDRPTQAGGGVNILSAQLLGTSTFLTGAFPAGYGNSLGGILDMRLRQGNDQQHEFTVQAGLIGLDLAAEGPFSVGSKQLAVGSKQLAVGSKQSAVGSKQLAVGSKQLAVGSPDKASYMANYRYSFTGLLAALGADFGDDQIAFQDLSVHISLPTAKAGRFSVFGVGGINSTRSYSLADQADVTEDKQRFDIEFLSKMGAAGLTHVLPMGKKSVWRSVGIVSALDHHRTSNPVWDLPDVAGWSEDLFTERKIALSSIFTTKLNARNRLRAGVQASQEFADFTSYFTSNVGLITWTGTVRGWLLQPFVDWHTHLSSKLELTTGLQVTHFTYSPTDISPEPRLALSFSPNTRNRISLSYSLLSQTHIPQLYDAPTPIKEGLGLMKSHHLVAAYRQELAPMLILTAELYYQHLFNVPVAENPGSTFSVLNLTEAYRLGNYVIQETGTGRNFGLDLSLQKFILDRYYFIAAGSLYRSLYTANDGVERPTRFDGRYLLNLTGGREFSKQKKEKVVIRGINAHFLWMGGFRAAPVDVAGSLDRGYTLYDESDGFPLVQADYLRLDLRFYLKWNRAGRNSTLSLDIQNVLNRKNVGFDYYDFVKNEVVTKRQLGLLPIVSWRVEF
ncbi:MAG: TonB-dependent receptor [Saprospirales bacterium]|nr:TonB-dependent receptor [Saprospirales bacterium]